MEESVMSTPAPPIRQCKLYPCRRRTYEQGNDSRYLSPISPRPVTGAGIAVHTNPCERLSVRVAVARVALRQCCAYAVCVCLSLSVTPCASVRLRRVRLSLSVTWSLLPPFRMPHTMPYW